LVRSAYLASAWLAAALAAKMVLKRLGPHSSVQIRYEDLVRNPQAAVAPILELLGADLPDGLFVDGKVQLQATHSAAGNARRFHLGRVELTEDLSWQSQLNPIDRRVVQLICWPVARQYGYS
jgi:hypothetical protein